MQQSQTRICIVGAGFGGLYTALYLQKFALVNQRCAITLIDPKSNFLFTPLVYEAITDELERWHIAPSYAELLTGTSVQFRQGTVNQVDLHRQQIHLDDGEVFSYDYLVLAVGGTTRLVGPPGVAEYAQTFRSLADVERLRSQIQTLLTQKTTPIGVGIVGAGPNGVELACKLADYLGSRGQVYLIERGEQILQPYPAAMQRAARNGLRRCGVRVEVNASIAQISAEAIQFTVAGDPYTLPTDLVVWTAGTQPLDWISQLPCPHNPAGQLLSLPTLQLQEHPNVLVLGDVADIRDRGDRRIPVTAQAAYQQATTAAANLHALLSQRRLRPFRFLYLGEMMTLGTTSALVYSRGLLMTGRLGQLIRRWAYLLRLPTLHHRLRVAWDWLRRDFNQISLQMSKLLTPPSRKQQFPFAQPTSLPSSKKPQ